MWTNFSSVKLPLVRGSSSAGAFAVAAKNNAYFPLRLSVVGGDYTKPDESSGNAAFVSSKDGARLPLSSYFTVATPVTPPHGYRSAVAYDAPTNTWITVGPNGIDISTDDGLNWHALKPDPTDAPDADKNWNALSLPFVVGPKGRVGNCAPVPLIHNASYVAFRQRNRHDTDNEREYWRICAFQLARFAGIILRLPHCGFRLRVLDRSLKRRNIVLVEIREGQLLPTAQVRDFLGGLVGFFFFDAWVAAQIKSLGRKRQAAAGILITSMMRSNRSSRMAANSLKSRVRM